MMKTLYIDVYFLINFTVDILAVYFAVSFSSVPTTKLRLALGGILGAMFATATIFIDTPIIKLILSLAFSVIIAAVSVRGASIFRRLKFFFAFLIFETLIGGAVYFMYSVLDKYIYAFIGDSGGGAENGSLVIVSIVILLSVGVFKLFLSFFSGEGRREPIRIEAEAFGKSIVFDAFVDSGNLLKDPTDLRPVMLIKRPLAAKFISREIISSDLASLSREARCRIRIIPVSDRGGVRILTGIRPDRVSVIRKNGRKEQIDVIIAIEREGGTYGGYEALVPSSCVDDVI